jgi:ElaB/YqjD/DUF883 family membrane-anchored ribosome-binding protein
MRLTHQTKGKDLARDIAALKSQLDELAEAVGKDGGSLVSRGEDALHGTLRATQELIDKYGDSARSLAHESVKLRDRAAHTIVEQTEARPLSTLAALIGIGFLTGYLCRRH